MKPTLLTSSLLFLPRVLWLAVCVMHSENVFSEGTKKPLRAEFVSCSHAWGLKGFFFLQQKRSFWFPWLCGCWFVFMVSSRWFLTNKFTFHVPTYTHAFCCLSVCNTHLECFSSWNILSNVCKSGQYRRGFFLSYDIKKAKLSGIAEVPFTDSPFYR